MNPLTSLKKCLGGHSAEKSVSNEDLASHTTSSANLGFNLRSAPDIANISDLFATIRDIADLVIGRLNFAQ